MTELGEIPKDWSIKTINDLIKENIIIDVMDGNHGEIHPKASEYVDIGIPFIMANNLKNGKLDIEGCKFISYEQAKRLRKGFSVEGDVLLTHKGTLGETAIVPKLRDEYIMLTPQVTYYRVSNNNVLINRYLKVYFDSKKYQDKLKSFGSQSTRDYVGITEQRKLSIILPTIEEQEKIASILSTVDEQIDNVDALIEKNKELKKGLMQTLLTKGIGHTKFKKTEIGEIPEEWDVKKLECVFEILDSMRKPIKASDREKIEGNIPYYGASGVIDWINDYIFDEELILLGEDGENLNSRNSDLAFKISVKTWVNNHAHVFRVINKKECNIDFMVYYLEAKDYSIYIAGSAQPKITQAQCRKFLLPLPEKQEQDKIASILLESDKKIEEYENKKQKLEELKKGLMQELLTGMIRVTV